jgi:hypothetical protein
VLFRSEKQWGRQRNSRGLAATLGLLLGTMSIAAPIYMLRTYLASIGREDQEEYLERRLSMYEIGKNTMNYVALSGLAPDFLEVAGAIAPEDFREALGMPAGGRYGAGGTAIGLADMGLNIQFNLGTGNASTGISGAYVESPAVTATLPFRIIGFIESPPGANGTDIASAYNQIIVGFNNVTSRNNGAGPTGI